MQFDPAIYSVNEGDQVVFMLELSSPADRAVTVDFTTVDGSAMSTSLYPCRHTCIYYSECYSCIADNDYVPVNQTITFSAVTIRRLVSVNTLDDGLSELTENFGAKLSNPEGNGLLFNLGSQDTATADISDFKRK